MRIKRNDLFNSWVDELQHHLLNNQVPCDVVRCDVVTYVFVVVERPNVFHMLQICQKCARPQPIEEERVTTIAPTRQMQLDVQGRGGGGGGCVEAVTCLYLGAACKHLINRGHERTAPESFHQPTLRWQRLPICAPHTPNFVLIAGFIRKRMTRLSFKSNRVRARPCTIPLGSLFIYISSALCLVFHCILLLLWLQFLFLAHILSTVNGIEYMQRVYSLDGISFFILFLDFIYPYVWMDWRGTECTGFHAMPLAYIPIWFHSPNILFPQRIWNSNLFVYLLFPPYLSGLLIWRVWRRT